MSSSAASKGPDTTTMTSATKQKQKLNVHSFPRPPLCERTDRHLVIKWNDTVIADTKEAYWVLETTHPPSKSSSERVYVLVGRRTTVRDYARCRGVKCKDVGQQRAAVESPRSITTIFPFMIHGHHISLGICSSAAPCIHIASYHNQLSTSYMSAQKKPCAQCAMPLPCFNQNYSLPTHPPRYTQINSSIRVSQMTPTTNDSSLLPPTHLPQRNRNNPIHNPTLQNNVRMERRSNIPQSDPQRHERHRQGQDLEL